MYGITIEPAKISQALLNSHYSAHKFILKPGSVFALCLNSALNEPR